MQHSGPLEPPLLNYLGFFNLEFGSFEAQNRPNNSSGFFLRELQRKVSSNFSSVGESYSKTRNLQLFGKNGQQSGLGALVWNLYTELSMKFSSFSIIYSEKL